MAATKASAVTWPTPGIVINRWQSSNEHASRFMSWLIAAIAPSRASRAASNPRSAPDNAGGSPRFGARIAAGETSRQGLKPFRQFGQQDRLGIGPVRALDRDFRLQDRDEPVLGD